MRFLASVFYTYQFPSWPSISYWCPFKCLRKFSHIFKSKPFKEPRNRFPAWQTGMTTLLVIPSARLHRLEASIPWNRFLGSINVYKYGLRSLLQKEELVPTAYVPWRAVQQIRQSYRPARLGINSWAPLKVYKYGLWTDI